MDVRILSILVNDRVKKEVQQRLVGLNSLATIVGWPGDGSPYHVTSGPKGQLITTTLTVAQTAAIHELGSMARNIPKRPVMRETIRKNRKLLRVAATIIYNRVLHGLPAHRAIYQLGEFWQHRVDATFDEGRFRQLKANTIAKRVSRGNTSTQPLVDYGHLRATVTHKMVHAGYR